MGADPTSSHLAPAGGTERLQAPKPCPGNDADTPATRRRGLGGFPGWEVGGRVAIQAGWDGGSQNTC